MYQNEQHYVLNSATAFPMMNKEMISKSDLRKLTGNSFDPISIESDESMDSKGIFLPNGGAH